MTRPDLESVSVRIPVDLLQRMDDLLLGIRLRPLMEEVNRAVLIRQFVREGVERLERSEARPAATTSERFEAP